MIWLEVSDEAKLPIAMKRLPIRKIRRKAPSSDPVLKGGGTSVRMLNTWN